MSETDEITGHAAHSCAACAQSLRARADEIVARFMERVRTDPCVPEADRLEEVALEDDVPEIVDGIARALDAAHLDAAQGEGSAGCRRSFQPAEGAAERHTRQRIEHDYSIVSLLRELSHLRTVVYETLAAEGPVPPPVLVALHAVIDDAMIAAAREAHDRLTADARLSAAKYQRITESDIVGVVVGDESGVIREANGAFLRMVGYSPEELGRGELRWSAITPPERALEAEAMARELSATGILRTRSTEYLARSGARVPAAVAGTRLPDGNVIVLVQNVSEQADALERERAEAAVREHFAAVLSHDLRQPLQSLTMGTSLLLDQGGLTAPQVRLVDRMLRASSRMTNMIESVLDVARIRSGHMVMEIAPTRVSRTVAEVVDELRVAHPEATIEVSPHREITAMWDAAKIARVLGNVIGNAIQHGAPGAPVRVEVETREDRVVLSVTNENRDGPIPPELRAGLFEPFRQGGSKRKQRPGLGLGLYIACQIVKAHGGSIGVESDEARTVFRVELPTSGPAPVAPSETGGP